MPRARNAAVSGAILWDVDTQVDFVHADGKLPIPGAEEVVPAMRRLVRAAREAGIPHVASADDHELTDAEISDSPDFEATYPRHCLRGTRGARKIPETEQQDPVPIGFEPLPERFLRGREFLILKKHFDVFTNPNAERLLELLDPDGVIVFGVATDVCDDAAIRGLLERGRRVRFVEDAARGLDEERVARCTALWREAGVEFTTSEAVAQSLQG
jgi:nicotinamidase/pyrazinamidase